MRYRFADYEFDPDRGLEGPRGRVALARRDVALLRALLEADGRILSKDAAVDAAWQGRATSDDSIFQSVRRLRAAMPASAGTRIIETVYGVGTRIGVPVTLVPDRPVPTVPEPAAETAGPRGALSSARECLVTAREMIGRRTLRDLASATIATRHAVRLAPGYIDAWVLLAQISILRVNRGHMKAPRFGIRRARLAAQRALRLSPRCDGALTILGWISAVVDGDTAAGLAMFDEALAINHTDWVTHSLRAWALYADRRPSEGLDAFAAMLDYNPLPVFSIGTYGYALGCAGQFAPALTLLDHAIRRMPEIDSLFSARSSVAAMAGDLDLALRDARRSAQLAPEVPNQLYALAWALAATGMAGEARDLYARMLRMRCRIAPSWQAVVLAGVGEPAAAAAALALARREGCAWLSFVQYDPRLKGIRPVENPVNGASGRRPASVPSRHASARPS